MDVSDANRGRVQDLAIEAGVVIPRLDRDRDVIVVAVEPSQAADVGFIIFSLRCATREDAPTISAFSLSDLLLTGNLPPFRG
jgi:hypothetical protein